MNNRNTTILIVAGLALLLGVFYFLGARGAKSRFNWADSDWEGKSYSENNDQPYGTRLLRQLLNGYFPGQKVTDLKKPVHESLPLDSTTSASSYVFVGEGMFFDSSDVERLLAFVGKGNTALLISKTVPDTLMDRIYGRVCNYQAGWHDYQQHENTFIRSSLLQPALTDSGGVMLYYAQQNQPKSYTWSFIPAYVFCENEPQVELGLINDSLVNFARFPFQKGQFLLNTTPLAFSNFQLLKKESRVYAEGVLSHLPPGHVYWDAVSRVPESLARRRNAGSRSLPNQHALTFILQQEPLAWAWYLLLLLAVTYTVFRARRRQRIIPVLPRNDNSSYEFISTIAHLHFRQRNYQGISITSMRLFLAQLRERYGLHVPLDLRSDLPKTDDALLARLSAVSEVPEVEIRRLFATYSDIARFRPSEQGMVDFHQMLERFWKVAK